MIKKLSLVAILSLLFIIMGCQQQEPVQPEQTELFISAAASLTDVLQELKSSFEQEHSQIKLTYNFGSSGKLATQIAQGAPVDVFLSASPQDMDALEQQNLIVVSSRVNFAMNQLVLITNRDSPLSYDSFEQINPEHLQHFAIGEPQVVPVGRYTKELLENLQLWDKLQGKLVMGSDVRQVLTYVDSGNADAGVVYASDARTAKNIKVLATADPKWHQPIVYPAAVLASSEKQTAAQAFLSYLTSETGKEVLRKHGFSF